MLDFFSLLNTLDPLSRTRSLRLIKFGCSEISFCCFFLFHISAHILEVA